MIKGSKILEVITHYSSHQEYPKKSHIVNFCNDFNLNYNQWNGYAIGKQPIGIKPIFEILKIFPDINLNWLFKDEGEMFCKISEPEITIVNEKLNEDITIKTVYNEVLDLKRLIVNNL